MKVLKSGLAAAFLLLTLVLSAQRPHHDPIERFKSELQLSPEQESALQAIREKYRARYEELKADDSLEGAARREAFHEMRKAQRAEVEKVLTEEQLELLRSKREAHEPPHHKPRFGERDELRDMHREMKAYHETEILPVLRAQRAKLEERLEPADRETIAKLRQSFEELKALKKAFRDSKKRGEEPSEELLEKRKAWGETHRANHETLKALAEKYGPDIDRLMEEIAEAHERWRSDLENIREKYLPEDAPPPHHRRRGWKGKLEEPGLMRKSRFLLLEPAASTNPSQATPDLKLRVAPNPSGDLNRISYELEQAAQIRVELRSEEGELLRVVFEGQVAAGAYQHELDLSELKNGVYVVTVLQQGQPIASQKLILSR